MSRGASLFQSLRQMDALLLEAGVPPLSPWWLSNAERFYCHPTALNWVARVGRGGNKSTAGVKLSMNSTLFDDFAVPTGERHYFVFVSVTKEEADKRLFQIAQYLDILGFKYTQSGDVIALDGMPRGFRVVACNVPSASGYRAFGYMLDEVAKYRTQGSSPVHNGPEVAATIRAMTVTHANARGLVFSSPLGKTDYHYECVERGDNDNQIVSIAPSWVANPGAITEEMARRLEPDEKLFSREYQALPQDTSSAAISGDMIERMFLPFPMTYERPERVMIVDGSAGRGDSFAYAIAGWAIPSAQDLVHQARPILVVDQIASIDGQFSGSVTFAEVIERLAETCREEGIRRAFGDQYLAYAIEAEFAKYGVHFTSYPWTAELKATSVSALRRAAADGTISLCEDGELRRQLASYTEHILPSGTTTYGARTGHDDRVAIVITLLAATIRGDLTQDDGRIDEPPDLSHGRWGDFARGWG